MARVSFCLCIVLVNSVDDRDRRTMVLGVVGDSKGVTSDGHSADQTKRRRKL